MRSRSPHPNGEPQEFRWRGGREKAQSPNPSFPPGGGEFIEGRWLGGFPEWEGGRGGHANNVNLVPSLGPPGFTLLLPDLIVGKLGGITFLPGNRFAVDMPRGQLTLPKGTKGGAPPRGGPLWTWGFPLVVGLGCHSRRPLVLFFFFFFDIFVCLSIVFPLNKHVYAAIMLRVLHDCTSGRREVKLNLEPSMSPSPTRLAGQRKMPSFARTQQVRAATRRSISPSTTT
eukprot:FR743787.1.p1 GENE.FR743787.1~~FR743787.1.p1  ORF type:complete len:228 (-),score=41.78 FR743787.1:366-1049(-)